MRRGSVMTHCGLSRTGQDIPNDVVYQISSHPNFLGVKECTGNPRIQVRASSCNAVDLSMKGTVRSSHATAPLCTRQVASRIRTMRELDLGMRGLPAC